MTSNLGSEIIGETMDQYPDDEERGHEAATRELNNMLRKVLRPEFLNRVDETVVFRPLGMEDVVGIARMQTERLIAALESENIGLEVSNDLIRWMAEDGYDRQFGARPVKRVIQKMLVNELSREIIAGRISRNSMIYADLEEGSVVFRNRE
jgi:ATP-dependent Clp protease ATP-binding subunit ClpB